MSKPQVQNYISFNLYQIGLSKSISSKFISYNHIYNRPSITGILSQKRAPQSGRASVYRFDLGTYNMIWNHESTDPVKLMAKERE